MVLLAGRQFSYRFVQLDLRSVELDLRLVELALRSVELALRSVELDLRSVQPTLRFNQFFDVTRLLNESAVQSLLAVGDLFEYALNAV